MSQRNPPSRAQQVEDALIVAGIDVAAGWTHLFRALNIDERTGGWVLARFDLTDSEGWIEAPNEQRRRILDTALQFLESIPEKYPDKALNESIADAGYRAAVLLQDASPSDLDRVSANGWRYWLPSFAAAASGTSDREPFQRLTAVAYQRYPTEALDALRNALVAGASHGAGEILLQGFDPLWDAPIADEVTGAATDLKLPVHVLDRVISSLLRHDDPRGGELAARCRIEGAESERAVIAGRRILIEGDATSIADWVEVFKADEHLARKVLMAAADADYGGGVPSPHLPEELVGELYLLAVDLFPPGDDPELRSGTEIPEDPRVHVGWLRDRFLWRLASRGSWNALEVIERIAELRPDLALPRAVQSEAIDSALRNTWSPIDPVRAVLAVVSDAQRHIVRSADQLLDLVVESLGRLQAHLLADGAVADLWSEWGWPLKYRPKRELSLADYVKRYLDRDLRQYLIAANREVENQRGNETDILVECFVPVDGGTPQRFAVVIEAKGSWNDHLLTAMETQLANRYLRDYATDRGVYLVGWYNCDSWDPEDSARAKSRKHDFKKLSHEVSAQALSLTNDVRRIEAVVLDATLR